MEHRNDDIELIKERMKLYKSQDKLQKLLTRFFKLDPIAQEIFHETITAFCNRIL